MDPSQRHVSRILGTAIRILVIAAAIGLELFVAYSIRDNLTLNILNFMYASPAIAEWQSGL